MLARNLQRGLLARFLQGGQAGIDLAGWDIGMILAGGETQLRKVYIRRLYYASILYAIFAHPYATQSLQYAKFTDPVGPYRFLIKVYGPRLPDYECYIFFIYIFRQHTDDMDPMGLLCAL